MIERRSKPDATRTSARFAQGCAPLPEFRRPSSCSAGSGTCPEGASASRRACPEGASASRRACPEGASASRRMARRVLYTGIVKSLRTAVSAVALIVALFSAMVVPTYAVEGRSRCAPETVSDHGCCKTPVLKACCSNPSDRSNQGTPAQPRVQVAPGFSAVPSVFVVNIASSVRVRSAGGAPPRAGPVDLPTLLSTLLL
jgi:hypothetical protein